jgi:hypothetical protein
MASGGYVPRLVVVLLGAVLALSGCSQPEDLVLVHKADGYYLADGSCPQRMVTQVDVVRWDEQAGRQLGDPWIVRTATSTNEALPSSGLPIGGDGAGWGSVEGNELVLAEDWTIGVRTGRDGQEPGGMSYFYPLNADVGQFVDSHGGVGQWSDLVAAQSCLAE